MSIATTLSDRMKEYESQTTQSKLIKKLPVIIRLDGVGFSKFTRGMVKPFDLDFSEIMQKVSMKLMKEIQGTKFIYSQSDEISLLLTDWDHTKEEDGGRTDTWFDYRISKMVSVASAKATQYFNEEIFETFKKYERLLQSAKCGTGEVDIYFNRRRLWERKMFNAIFDARAFNLPLDEVTNYFIFRQQDALRNSISSLARKYYSTKQLQGVKNTEKIKMMEKDFGVNFEKDISQLQKVGFTIISNTPEEIEGTNKTRFELDTNIPIFKEDREYIERYL